MKLNIQQLFGFVALGYKSAGAALSHTLIKVARISSLLAQIEQVKLVIIKEPFFERKKYRSVVS